jgi:hypothetical protein
MLGISHMSGLIYELGPRAEKDTMFEVKVSNSDREAK